MPAVLAAVTGSDWNEGGALFTFWFPLGLFIVIAAILFLLFTRPHTVPGRKPLALARPGGPARAQATGTPASPPSPDHEVPEAGG